MTPIGSLQNKLFVREHIRHSDWRVAAWLPDS